MDILRKKHTKYVPRDSITFLYIFVTSSLQITLATGAIFFIDIAILFFQMSIRKYFYDDPDNDSDKSKQIFLTVLSMM